jgi:mxaC protein
MTDALHLSLARPSWLWCLLLLVLPWLLSGRLSSAWPWLGTVPVDAASRVVDLGLRTLSCVAFAAFALAGAGLIHGGETIERTGRGAHIVLVIDRSSSMNETFAGTTPNGGEESKAAAAKHLLQAFNAHRGHDLVGMVAFSTAPMFVLPLTGHQEAVNGAIDAIDRPGLAYTDVARGLAMALGMFDDSDPLASRVIVLVSDGAAVIARRVQERLRSEIAGHSIHLYWLFLRTRGGPGIFDLPDENTEDTPQEMPERHLNLFFQSLGVPYRAFEAADAGELARAIDEIDRTESAPIRYGEAAPQHNLAPQLFALAALATALLAAAKLTEVRIGAVSAGDLKP